MGVQSRRRRMQKAMRPIEPPTPPPTKDEQTERYFANWVDGHPGRSTSRRTWAGTRGRGPRPSGRTGPGSGRGARGPWPRSP
jgi:hypothetical protein